MATDNSGEVISSSYPQLTSPHTFSEGITTVIYVAEDPTGNKAYCNFKISVQGIVNDDNNDTNYTQHATMKF